MIMIERGRYGTVLVGIQASILLGLGHRGLETFPSFLYRAAGISSFEGVRVSAFRL